MQNNSQKEAKKCAENAITNGDHWLLHTIIGTKETTILQEVLTSHLILKHNIISTQKAIAEAIMDIKVNIQANNNYTNHDKRIKEQDIKDRKKTNLLASYILISSPNSEISFYSAEQKKKAMNQDSYDYAKVLAEDLTHIYNMDKSLEGAATELEETLNFQDKYLKEHSSRLWVTSTSVGKFLGMQEKDFENMFNDLIDVRIKTESESSIDDIKNQKKEYNEILIKIADTINEIQKGNLLDKFYEILKEQSKNKINNEHFGQITKSEDLIELFDRAAKEEQNKCMLVLLANCPEIDPSKSGIQFKDLSAYIAFFSLYEPLFQELIDLDKCFLSFEDLGAVIHKDRSKTLYVMQKQIEKSQKWVETFCDPETKEVMNWRSSGKTAHLYRVKRCLYLFILKSFHEYVEERKEECDEYSSILIKHLIENDGIGFIKAVYDFKHKKNFSHAGMADVNKAAKKELAGYEKMKKQIDEEDPGRESTLKAELEKRYGAALITIDKWRTKALQIKATNARENEQRTKKENEELTAKIEQEKRGKKELRELHNEIVAENFSSLEQQKKTIDDQKKKLDEKDKELDEQGKKLDEQGKKLSEKDQVIAELMRQLEQQEHASSNSPSRKVVGATAATVGTRKCTQK